MIVYPDLVKLYGLAAEMMSCNSDKIRMQSWPEDDQDAGDAGDSVTGGVPRQVFKFTCNETCNDVERQTDSLTLTMPLTVPPWVPPRVNLTKQCSANLYNLPSDVPEGTTHIDMDDDSSSRFMKLMGDEWYCNSDSIGWVYLSPNQIEPGFQCVKVEDYYVGYNT